MRTTPADLRLYYLQRSPPQIPAVSGLQTYFPSLEVLFPSVSEQNNGSPCLAASELAVDISTDGVAVVEHLTEKTRRSTPIWIRQIHLLEPIDVMSGHYVMPTDGSLPTFRQAWQQTLRKINDPYNEAYTDAVFACMASRLVETRRSPHWCRFFGTVTGRVPEYRYNITDDMPDIENEKWFKEGLRRGDFEILAVDPYDPEVTAQLQKPWESIKGLHAGRIITADDEELELLDSDEEEEIDLEDATTTSVKSDGELQEADDIPITGEATIVRPRLQLLRLEDSGGSYETDSQESDYLEYRAVIRNFPVQMSILERCDGTMDTLMEDEEDGTDDMRETKEQRWTAWVFQVIAALTTAQAEYDFIHNDLHTNNIMWCGTGETHLYYHVKGGTGGDRYYRVPTYGRIFKIIDFGRATYRPPAAALAKSKNIWLPDAYAPGADADGQYNCGQYFDKTRPKIQPNKSFDLCRLAVAMMDTLWPEEPATTESKRILTKEPGRTQYETVSPLWNLLWLWLTDKAGKNIHRTPAGEDRYPDFSLYCAIAATAKNAVPAQQVTLPLFDTGFKCKKRDIPADAMIWDLTI